MTIQEDIKEHLSKRNVASLTTSHNRLLEDPLDAMRVTEPISFIERNVSVEIPIEIMTIENLESIDSIEAHMAHKRVGFNHG